MATEKTQITDTRKAGADLSAKQFYFVKLDSSGDVVVCAAATDKPYGVLQNDPTSGEEALVCILGITKVSANGALSIDDLIGTSADGQADGKTPGTDTTEYVVGRARSAATAAGDLITAVVNCTNPHRAA